MGSFHVTLVVTAPGGASAETSQQVPVAVQTAPTVEITFSPTDPAVGETVQFDGRTTLAPDLSPIVSYTWDFGDLLSGNTNTATGELATHVYTVDRTYTVRLTVRDARGRTATTTTTVTVVP
jgi:hexosaminidase